MLSSCFARDESQIVLVRLVAICITYHRSACINFEPIMNKYSKNNIRKINKYIFRVQLKYKLKFPITNTKNLYYLIGALTTTSGYYFATNLKCMNFGNNLWEILINIREQMSIEISKNFKFRFYRLL